MTAGREVYGNKTKEASSCFSIVPCIVSYFFAIIIVATIFTSTYPAPSLSKSPLRLLHSKLLLRDCDVRHHLHLSPPAPSLSNSSLCSKLSYRNATASSKLSSSSYPQPLVDGPRKLHATVAQRFKSLTSKKPSLWVLFTSANPTFSNIPIRCEDFFQTSRDCIACLASCKRVAV